MRCVWRLKTHLFWFRVKIDFAFSNCFSIFLILLLCGWCYSIYKIHKIIYLSCDQWLEDSFLLHLHDKCMPLKIAPLPISNSSVVDDVAAPFLGRTQAYRRLSEMRHKKNVKYLMAWEISHNAMAIISDFAWGILLEPIDQNIPCNDFSFGIYFHRWFSVSCSAGRLLCHPSTYKLCL